MCASASWFSLCRGGGNVDLPNFSTAMVQPTDFLPTPSQDNPITSLSMSSPPQETLGNYKRNKWERVLHDFPQFLRRKLVKWAQTQLISSNSDLDMCSQWFTSRPWHHLDSNILPSNKPPSLPLRFLPFRQISSSIVFCAWKLLHLIQTC